MDEFDLDVRFAVYRHFASTGRRPTAEEVAASLESSAERVLTSFRRLAAAHGIVLDEDGASIRMALPFSGVPTQHVVESQGVSYFANCAWDALGIPAALQREGFVRSRCEASLEPLQCAVRLDAPPDVDPEWRFHSVVPAAGWWDDIVFT